MKLRMVGTLALIWATAVAFSGCPRAADVVTEKDRLPPPESKDTMADRAEKFVYLSQNWSPAETLEFYSLPHGSQLVPYSWFLHLEQVGKQELFRSNANMQRLRFLPQKPHEKYNPDGLPIGFVKDGQLDWLGLNCAACHTTQINFRGTGILVDGAPAMANLDMFLNELTEALKQVRDDGGEGEGKPAGETFKRFAKNVLGDRAKRAEERAILLDKLRAVIDRRENYNKRNGNDSRIPWGYSRIDALGAILNQVTALRLQVEENERAADAPVSIPFLWDTPAHKQVQWNGAASNSQILGLDLGALGRNVGEVLGVFGEVRVEPGSFKLWPGYPSSVRLKNLDRSEELVSTLWSPEWPGEVFKHPLDKQLVAKGKDLYVQKKCVDCHHLIDRTTSKLVAGSKWETLEQMVPIGSPSDPPQHFVGTDPRMAGNFITDRATGPLKDRKKNFLPLTEEFGSNAPAGEILAHIVIGTIIHGPANEDQELPAGKGFAAAPAEALKYKARPLNGIWATAPYLHNGSVPSLRQLLLPPKDGGGPGFRSEKFITGRREFDPDEVGFKQFENPKEGEALGFSLIDTTQLGNSNSGHVYGALEFDWQEKDGGEPQKILPLTADEREALLEYLRSL